MISSSRRRIILNILVNILAFIVGSSITLSFTSVDQTCRNERAGVFVHEQNVNDDNDFFLVILILSAPNNIKQRDSIRNTWLKINFDNLDIDLSYNRMTKYNENGFMIQDSVEDQITELERFKNKLMRRRENRNSWSNLRVLHYFAISTEALPNHENTNLLEEMRIHKDLILFSDLHDSYANLTKKILRSIVVFDGMTSFKYLLKVDDDTYVKLDLLMEELVTYDQSLMKQSTSPASPRPELYWGYFNGRAKIHRSGRWKETDFKLSEQYLPYALGGGYAISREIVRLLAANAQYLSTFVSEDVSMGVWLSSYRHIYRKHDVRFDTAYMPRKCQRHHILLHKRSVSNMYDIHKGLLCTFDHANDTSIRRPKEYFYDFDRSPNNCCENASPE